MKHTGAGTIGPGTNWFIWWIICGEWCIGVGIIGGGD